MIAADPHPIICVHPSPIQGVRRCVIIPSVLHILQRTRSSAATVRASAHAGLTSTFHSDATNDPSIEHTAQHAYSTSKKEIVPAFTSLHEALLELSSPLFFRILLAYLSAQQCTCHVAGIVPFARCWWVARSIWKGQKKQRPCTPRLTWYLVPRTYQRYSCSTSGVASRNSRK